MKKILLSIVIALSLVIGFSSRQNVVGMNELALQNVEAIAEGEVEIEAICMGTDGLCIVYPNGYFILGIRVA